MKDYNFEQSNVYASEKLYILEKVDKEDNLYYPNDDITFTIICINNSNEELENILIRDILPNEVIPLENGLYNIEANKGEISQKGNVVELKISKIKAKEAIKLVIKGKVKE